MKLQKVLFFCCLLGGQMLAMEEKLSQALVQAKPDRADIVREEIADRATTFKYASIDVNHHILDEVLKRDGEEGLFEVLKKYGVLHRARRIIRSVGKYPTVEAYEQALDCWSLERVPALLEEHINDLVALKNSPQYAPVLQGDGISKNDVDWILEVFQRDLQTLKVLSVLSVAEASGASGFEGSIDEYQRGFAQALQRVVAQEEVLGLLKKSIDDLEDARRNPRFAEASRLCGYDESFIDDVLVTFKDDLQALTETVAKNGAAVVGNAETRGK